MRVSLPSLGRLVRLAFAMGFCLAAFASTALARAPLLDEQRGVLTLAPLLEKTTPAVVSISVQSGVPAAENPLFRDPFFRRFFGLPEVMPETKDHPGGFDSQHLSRRHAAVHCRARVRRAFPRSGGAQTRAHRGRRNRVPVARSSAASA
jgi:S1-C subfamily serine protease